MSVTRRGGFASVPPGFGTEPHETPVSSHKPRKAQSLGIAASAAVARTPAHSGPDGGIVDLIRRQTCRCKLEVFIYNLNDSLISQHLHVSL